MKDGYDTDGLQLYRCLRSTSQLESLHSRMVASMVKGKIGPRLAAALWYDYRHRSNISAMIKNRGVINFHHFELEIIERIQKITDKLYGTPVFQSWRSTEDFLDTKEYFGLETFTRQREKNNNYMDDMEADPDLSEGLHFLAHIGNTRIPFTPVATVNEKKLFNKIRGEVFGDNINFDLFALEWDKNVSVQDNIFRKHKIHLEKYHKTHLKNINRKNTIDKNFLSEINEFLNENNIQNTIEFADAIDPEELPLINGTSNNKDPIILLDVDLERITIDGVSTNVRGKDKTKRKNRVCNWCENILCPGKVKRLKCLQIEDRFNSFLSNKFNLKIIHNLVWDSSILVSVSFQLINCLENQTETRLNEIKLKALQLKNEICTYLSTNKRQLATLNDSDISVVENLLKYLQNHNVIDGEVDDEFHQHNSIFIFTLEKVIDMKINIFSMDLFAQKKNYSPIEKDYGINIALLMHNVKGVTFTKHYKPLVFNNNNKLQMC